MWFVPCNAHSAVRIPQHIGDLGHAPAAELTVCASYGTRFIPQTPQVTLTAVAPRRRGWLRPILAFTWWRYRRECARRGLHQTGCAVEACQQQAGMTAHGSRRSTAAVSGGCSAETGTYSNGSPNPRDDEMAVSVL